MRPCSNGGENDLEVNGSPRARPPPAPVWRAVWGGGSLMEWDIGRQPYLAPGAPGPGEVGAVQGGFRALAKN